MAEDTKTPNETEENKNGANNPGNESSENSDIQINPIDVPEPIRKDRSFWWLWVILAAIAIGFIYWWVCMPAAETEAPKSEPNKEKVEGTSGNACTPQAEATASEQAANAAVVAEEAASGKSFAEIDAMATKTIKGNYGNGKYRKNKLGKDYKPVQARVNQRMHKSR